MDIEKSHIIQSNKTCEKSSGIHSFTFEQLIECLNSIVERIIGIKAIYVTDQDGVNIIKVISKHNIASKNNSPNPAMSNIFSNLVSSCHKLDEFGQASFIIIHTNKDSIFQVNYYPLIIHIISRSEFEGEILELMPFLKELLLGVRNISSIFNSESTNTMNQLQN